MRRRARSEVALSAGAPYGAGHRGQAEMHHVPRLRRRLSGRRRCSTPRTSPQLQVHRAQLRAVRAVREDLPGGRDQPRAAAAARAGRRRRPVVLNEDKVVRTACAAASRSRTSASSTTWSGGSPSHSMFRGSRRAAPPADVPGLPRDRHVRERATTARSSTTAARGETARDERTASDVRGTADAVPEEDARAPISTALIGRLFYAPPDPNLLAEIPAAPRGCGTDGERWHALGRGLARLQDACRSAYPAVVRAGVRQPVRRASGSRQVTPYTSRLCRGDRARPHLVRLREQLDALGLARRECVFEVEDHISGVCDVMRWLIEDGHSLSEQQRCSSRSLSIQVRSPFAMQCRTRPSAVFYQAALRRLRARFFEVETAAFEMHESEA